MRSYQVVVVVKPSSESDRKKIMTFVTGLLKDLKVEKEEDLGSKALSYKIKSELTGHYYSLQLTGETFPKDFEKKMLENEAILRHLTIRTK